MIQDVTAEQPTQLRSMRPFLTIWTGQAVSLLGSQLVQFALIWWLAKTTDSATTLATAAMMSVLPAVFISPFAGALIDRWNRRIVVMVADAVIALATVVLALLYGLGVVQIWHVYVLMFVRATAGVFHWPAMGAATALMVPEEHLARVAGMNQTLLGAVGIGAPPLGALLLELLPMQYILAIDVGTAALAIAPLFFISIPQPERADQAPAAGGALSFARALWVDMREGFHFVWGWRGMVIMSGMIMLLNLMFSPLSALVPLLTTRHFGGGAVELAWLNSAFGVGAILGGLILSVWGGFKRRILTIILAMILHGVGVAVIGVAPSNGLLLAVAAMFVAGLSNPLIIGPWVALVQATVPPHILGRVTTLQGSLVMAASPVGLAIAGPIVDATGARIWYLIAGIILAAAGVIALFIPDVVQIEERAPGSGEPAVAGAGERT